MSWLDFFKDEKNLSLIAELVNSERSRNVVTAPFSIQALHTPPEDTKVVLYGQFDGRSTKHATVFDLSPANPLWNNVANCMVRHINASATGIAFVVVGPLMVPHIDRDNHLIRLAHWNGSLDLLALTAGDLRCPE